MLDLQELSLNIPTTDKKRVVIVGGGFGGINLAKRLSHQYFQVVLFDRQNYHGFWPLLYQVATAVLEPVAIAEPLRKLFDEDYKDFHFRPVRVKHIDPKAKLISTLVGVCRKAVKTEQLDTIEKVYLDRSGEISVVKKSNY